MAANLRIISQNLIDSATVTASSSASASLGASNLLTDIKSSVWRSIGTTARLDVLLASAGIVGGIALPFTNLSAAATMRVRMSNEAAATNLLSYPRNFDKAAWIRFGTVSIDPNSGISSDGTQTADRVNFTSANAGLYQFVGASPGVTYTFSIVIEAVIAGPVKIILNSNLGDPVTAVVNGTTTRQRFSVTKTMAAGTTSVSAQIQDNGSGGTAFKLWHAQLEVGTKVTSIAPDATTFTSRASSKHYFDQAGMLQLAGPNVAVTDYDPVSHVSRGLSLESAATNLLIYPRNFDNAAWTKVRAAITPNAGAAADGTMTADKLVEDTTVSNTHVLEAAIAATSGTTYTLSVLAKAAERTKLVLQLGNATPTTNGLFDLSAGTCTAGTITAVGNGMYRCAITATATSTANLFCDLFLHNGVSATYTGDGISGLYLWHAQLEAGSSATSIIPEATAFVSRASDRWEFNSAGVLTQYAPNVAVTAYDPVTLVSRGLSLEPQATNRVRNSTVVGLVLGSPGTSPNNWGLSIPPGLVREYVATSTDDGINYLDVRVYGTSTGAGQINFAFEHDPTGCATTVGDAWALSVYLSAIAGSTAGTNFKLTLDQYSSVGNWVTGGPEVAVAPTPGKLSGQRRTVTITVTNASTAYVKPVLYSSIASGAVIDITLRIGLPNLDKGAFATSPIKTTGTAVTRAADISTSPQATRAADISTSPQVTRTAGYIDAWQSYDYDSGYVTACPGGVRDVWGWQPAQLNVASYGFGGGCCARAWTPRNAAKGIAIEISDPGNTMGYIEAARLVVGDYWSPMYNIEYGGQQIPIDNTTHDRSGAGDQRAIPGTRHDSLSVNFQWLTPADRSALSKIVRRNGLLTPMFVSAYPDASDPALEADHQIYGRLSSLGALSAHAYGYYNTPLAIEQI